MSRRLLLVRHAQAGESASWAGDDSLRPLDERGRRQALGLVDALSRFEVERILSSPARRCLQTVEPLAAARGLDVEVRPELGEELQATEGAELATRHAGQPVVLCTHGGFQHDLLGAAAEDLRYPKGGTLVLAGDLAVEDVIPPPA